MWGKPIFDVFEKVRIKDTGKIGVISSIARVSETDFFEIRLQKLPGVFSPDELESAENLQAKRE